MDEARATADHPRSRGVYFVRSRRAAGGGWIIPARAGFTARAGDGSFVSADHPRSRGVYERGLHITKRSRGSSPLARGLRDRRASRRRTDRIIPARAGFTARSLRRRSLVADHPRSRGVYTLVQFELTAGLGSSPLARGLPPPTVRTTPRTGIIPARAGFTSTRPSSAA